MIVMPANATGWFWHCLARETGRIGHLYSPGAQRGPWPWFPFALDIQQAKANSDNFASTPFLHNSRKPLDTIDFRNDVDKGQTLLSFMDECEGMCGV